MSVFCEDTTKILELADLFQCCPIDVEAARCSADLNCLGFADADFHAEVLTLCVQAVRVLLEFPFFVMYEALIVCERHLIQIFRIGVRFPRDFVHIYTTAVVIEHTPASLLMSPPNHSVSPSWVRIALMLLE